MSAEDLKELDRRVLDSIRRNSGNQFSEIKLTLRPRCRYRELDRSLQRLRRKGLVSYTRAGGWVAE